MMNMYSFYKKAVSVAVAATVIFGTAESTHAASFSGNNDSTLVTVSSTSTNAIPKDLAQKLQSRLDKTIKDKGIPGAAVGITSPEGTWFGASGVSNLATGTLLRPEDRFPIGSTTKPFTAATVLLLAEEGKLSLEDTLDKWLPASIVNNITDGKNITIRQLLNGTSGIYDFLNRDEALIQAEILKNPTKQWSPEELVAYAYGKERQSWEYPSTGIILAGMIVEKATGSTFAEVLRSRILDRLGMNNTFFAPQEQIPGGYVNGYLDYDNNGTLDDVTPINLSFGWTAGAIVSNTQDLTKFAQALFGGKLLSSDSLNQMLNFVDIGVGDSFKYGLGLTSREFEGIGRAWGHRGDAIGHGSQWWYFPELGVTYVNLQNSQPQSDDILSSMLKTLLAKEPKRVPESSFSGGLIVLGAAVFFFKRKLPLHNMKSS
jgi:D-alanyl-D-alanine carboxypeptidase